jgi:SAM-dependent methyltransferase
MSFSAEWEARYRDNTHMSVWPWSDLVSYIMRYAHPKDGQLKVLELGCGAGANIPFFREVANTYQAIEGSPSIVEQLKIKYPEFKSNIVCGDFTREIPFKDPFNTVVDRSSLTHNTTAAITNCLNLLYEKLPVGGKFVGIDWFSTEHGASTEGETTEDNFTRTNFHSGSMKGVGRVHFSDEKHLRELFHRFDLTVLEHKRIDRLIPGDHWKFGAWNFVAVKTKT